MRTAIVTSLAALAIVAAAACGSDGTAKEPAPKPAPTPTGPTETAIVAGGCFWCTEAAFDDLPGVIEAVSGYTGGAKPNPTYEEVSAGGTGHRESVQIRFDPTKISYAQILDVFWRQIDPTDAGGQFADRGSQYQAAIFVANDEQRRVATASKAFLEKSGWFDKPIATPILPAAPFYRAEEYHQDYHVKHHAEYAAYKYGSGRGPYIERVWTGKPPIVVASAAPSSPAAGAKRTYVKPSDEEIKKRLSSLQYEVTQHGATEMAFQNEYWDNHEPGIYVDIVTGEPLFSSTDKFESGTGWPSFSKPLDPEHVVKSSDGPGGMYGNEVHSKVGASHLGHVFGDGPRPTGLRYCIDSASLRFIPAKDLAKEGYGQYAPLFAAKPRS